MAGRRCTEKEFKARRMEKARGLNATSQHKSPSTEATKSHVPQKASSSSKTSTIPFTAAADNTSIPASKPKTNVDIFKVDPTATFHENLRLKDEAFKASVAKEKATKEAEKAAKKQREDEEKAEKAKKKSQENRAPTNRPTISKEERKRIRDMLREEDSEDEESINRLMEEKKTEKKKRAEKKKVEEQAVAEKKKVEENADAKKKKVKEQTKADKKSAEKAMSNSNSNALAASSEVDPQTPEKAKPVAPEESTSSKSAVEAQSTTVSKEATSRQHESISDLFSTPEPNDGSVQDVEQSASDQLDAEDNVDDKLAIETPKVLLPEHKEIERDFPKLSASQQANFIDILRHHHKKFDLDGDELFELADLPPNMAILLAVRLRSLLEGNNEQGQSEADQASGELNVTDQASTSPPVTEQREQTQTEQTQLSAPEGTVNKNGKRPITDETEPLAGPGNHRSKRRALSAESSTSPREKDAHAPSGASSPDDSATPRSTQKPVTVDNGAVKADIIPAVNGNTIAFGATPDAAATYERNEEQTAAILAAMSSKQSPQQQGKKRTAMEAEIPQPISLAPAKKSKLSDDASALIAQAGQATEESQAEATVTKPQEVAPKPETTSDSVKTSSVPVYDAPKDAESCATEKHTATEKSSDAKSSEDAKKSPATKETVGKAKSTTNTSATSAETQPKNAANHENADNSIVKPSVAKEAAVVALVSNRANNSSNGNTDDKARPAAQKSTSKTTTATKERQQQKPTTAITTKQSSAKPVPTALDAKKNTTATKKQSSATSASSVPVTKTAIKPSAPSKAKAQPPPLGSRFKPTTGEQREAQRLAQQHSQPSAPQSAQSAVKPAAKKMLADKTNTQPQPQRQRGPVAATTKKQLDAAKEKPAPQRPTAQKKRSREEDEVAAPVSKPAKKQRTDVSPPVPAKAAEKKGKRARDEDDEPETVFKPAKKQRTRPSPPPASEESSEESESDDDKPPPTRERASRSKTAAATKKTVAAAQPRRQVVGHADVPDSGDEESDVEPKPKKKAKAKTTDTEQGARDEQTAPAAATATTPSAAINTQQAPTDSTAAGPPRQRGIARSTNAQPRPTRASAPTAASLDAQNYKKCIR